MGKINRNIKIILVVIGILAIVLSSGKIFNHNIFGSANTEIISEEVTDNAGILSKIIKDYSYHRHDEEEDCYFVYDQNKDLICYVLFTSPYCDNIKGFGGNVPFAIVFNTNDEIERLILLENSETKSWINRLEKIDFFNSWTGMTAEQAIGENPDAVSGATLTSSAVIESVKCRLSEFISVSASKEKSNWINIVGIIASFLVLFLAVFSFFVPEQSKRLRIFLLIASIGILGFWQGDFLSMALLHNWLINGLSIKSQIFLFIVLILSILLPLLTNKAFYCQYLCPFGAAQELVGKLNKKKVTFDNRITRFLRSLKFVFLFVITVLLVIAIDIDLEKLEPFSAFKFNYASLSVLIMAIIIMFLSIFFNKPWCRFFCPTGALLSMFRGSTKKMKHRRFNIPVILSIFLAVAVLVLTYFLIKQPKMEVNNDKKETIIMEDMISVIRNRKSVRNFTDQPVTNEQLETLVKAGMAAPSARNIQPWAFVIIQDKEVMNALADSLPYAKMLKSAQAAIVVCGDLSKSASDIGQSFWIQDCSAATQNILLAAESIGLGAVWTATYPYQQRIDPVKEYLKLPEHIIPLNVIPIGYPTGEDKPKDKWKPENLHWEKW